MNSLSSNQVMRQTGFTLVEAVVIIIIISILAVTVVPKFVGDDSFDSYSFRVQLLASLRLGQQRAMQQSSLYPCYQYLVATKQAGFPDAGMCTANARFNQSAEQSEDRTRIEISSRSQVQLLLADSNNDGISSLNFDSWGRPGEDCLGGCRIDIVGTESVSVCIESQGYIHKQELGESCPN